MREKKETRSGKQRREGSGTEEVLGQWSDEEETGGQESSHNLENSIQKATLGRKAWVTITEIAII